MHPGSAVNFVSNQIRNPEVRFSHVKAHVINFLFMQGPRVKSCRVWNVCVCLWYNSQKEEHFVGQVKV